MVPASARLQRISIIKHVLFPESLLKYDFESPSHICVCFERIFSSHTNIRDTMCSGGLCYLFWKFLDCGTEKQSHWHYMLGELGLECWWRCFKKIFQCTHTVIHAISREVVLQYSLLRSWNTTTCWHFALSQNAYTAEGLVYFSSGGTVFTKHVSQLPCAQG